MSGQQCKQDPPLGDTRNANQVRALEERVAELEIENQRLRCQVRKVAGNEWPHLNFHSGLTKGQIERYCRQLLVTEGFGVTGQQKLLASSVLVVGAGGIGSTALFYLSAAGIGKISVIDYDCVETSNLHRQVIHKDCNVGFNKAQSACQAMKALNPSIEVEALVDPLTHHNAYDLVRKSTCVVDASDNPRTRYLINDACVLSGVPLISGSAVGVEGQLSVYNLKNGPCYRCLYPRREASSGCHTCSDAGVLGPVPGLIGVLQAMEAIKVITGVGETMHDRFLMYDALQSSFFTVKKPPKNPSCPVCGVQPLITTIQDSNIDLIYTRGPQGIGSGSSLSVTTDLPADTEISCREFEQVRSSGVDHVLLDVRVPKQYELCSLPHAVNIPLGLLREQISKIEILSGGTKPIYCICRRGIASREALRILIEERKVRPKIHSVYHVRGGLTAWAVEVDNIFPKY